MVIVVGGMIGLGKSSVAELLGKEFGTDVFYESVDDNPILPLFYTSSEEEIQARRYPFLLQLHFLDTRFKSIKKALVNDRNVLDRSIYEDWYFAKKNMELGRITELEMKTYESLLDNMMEELEELPKKAPDVMVYLKGSFETVLDRIRKRGRSYELDEDLVDYYRVIWEGYDNWVEQHYKASEVLVIDMDKIDIIENSEDAETVVQAVKDKLKELNGEESAFDVTTRVELEITESDKERMLKEFSRPELLEAVKWEFFKCFKERFEPIKIKQIGVKDRGIFN